MGRTMSRMYCLTCFYDLRGLIAQRCPECGRPFSPANPKSFSPTPRPERVHKLIAQASALLTDALATVEPTDPVGRTIGPLRRQVARLSAENADLRRQVVALTRVLLDRGLIDPGELAAAAEQMTPELEIIDDTEMPTANEGDEPTSDLLNLRRAIDGQP